MLRDETKEPVEYQNAYIIYNGERIDVSSCLNEHYGLYYVSNWDVAIFLRDSGKIDDASDIHFTTQTFELVKDGKSYFGNIFFPVPT